MKDYTKDKESENHDLYENDQAELRIYHTGQFLYHTKVNGIFTQNKAIQLSDEECIKKAKDFLEKNNLLHMDVFKITVNDITRTNAANLDKEEIIGKGVYFSRSINGNEVYGVSRINVTIAGNGEIAEVRSLYRNTGDSIKVKVKPMEEALRAVEKHDAMIEISPGVENVNFREG